MYTVTSSAGLNTAQVTAEQAVTVLGQHLHERAPDGPIRWCISTPAGLEFAGHLNLNQRLDDGFIEELLTELAQGLAARPTGRTA